MHLLSESYAPRLLFITTFLFVVFLIQKIIISHYLYSGQSIFDLGFGFGGYISSLIDSGRFQQCITSDLCNYASRMPGIPIILSFFSVFSESQLDVAIIKSTVFSIISFVGMLQIVKIFGHSALRIYFISYLIFILMLPVAKHSASIIYEEAYFVELLLPWSILNLYLMKFFLDPDKFRGNIVIIIFSILILSIYFFLVKSSMILLILWAIILFIASVVKANVNSMLCLLVIFSLSPIFMWGVHNHEKSDNFRIMSSWDGENFFKGNNLISLQIYPDISLDRVTDSVTFELGDGSIVTSPGFPDRAQFSNEWDWNDYYRDEGLRWIAENPYSFFKFTGKKFYNFFLSVQMTPYSVSASVFDYDRRSKGLYDSLVSLWMVFGRAMSAFTILALCYYAYKKRSSSLVPLIGLVGPLILYSAPFIVGLNYERHITPFFILLLPIFISFFEAFYNGYFAARKF